MVYVFLADGFEEMEALCTVDILRRASLDVRTVGIGGKRIVGAHGIAVEADINEAEALPDAPEAIVLPGGWPGTPHLEASEKVQRCIDAAVERGIPIAAICAAPSILGHKGLLRGKRATCFPGFEKELEGAVLSKDGVVLEGRILTAKGAGVAQEFALALVGLLCSNETADELRRTLQCV